MLARISKVFNEFLNVINDRGWTHCKRDHKREDIGQKLPTQSFSLFTVSIEINFHRVDCFFVFVFLLLP